MRYKVRHETTYKYAAKVSHCYNLANLTPCNTSRQQCIRHHIKVTPNAVSSSKQVDYFGNESLHFEIQTAHKKLSIVAESEVDVSDVDLTSITQNDMTYGQALTFYAQSTDEGVINAKEFCLDSPMIKVTDALKEYAKPSFSLDRPLFECVKDLTSRIFKEFTYTPGFTSIATPLSEVLAHKKGVCQDFAHLQVGCLRAMGIPAKYVSGYMETLPPPGQEKLVGADATHAWLAYYSPDNIWIEFDPTNDVLAGMKHIITAQGRDYSDVAPLKGVIFGGGEDPVLSVSVDVARIEPAGTN